MDYDGDAVLEVGLFFVLLLLSKFQQWSKDTAHIFPIQIYLL